MYSSVRIGVAQDVADDPGSNSHQPRSPCVRRHRDPRRCLSCGSSCALPGLRIVTRNARDSGTPEPRRSTLNSHPPAAAAPSWPSESIGTPSLFSSVRCRFASGVSGAYRTCRPPHACGAARKQDQQVVGGVGVAVGHPCAVDDHRMDEQRTAAVRRRPSPIQRPREDIHVVLVDLGQLLRVPLVMPPDALSGMAAFSEAFRAARKLLVGETASISGRFWPRRSGSGWDCDDSNSC